MRRRDWLAVVALAACGRESGAPAGRAGATAPLAAHAFYRIDAAPQPPCRAGATCEAELVLTALAGYKINRDYPHKFVALPTPGVELVGEPAFAVGASEAITGALTFRFRVPAPGTARVRGTFKLSVCTEDNCEIAEPEIAISIAAS